MTRPLSNIDTALLENLVAISLDGDDLCKLLALYLDNRENLQLLATIQSKFTRQREIILKFRAKVKKAGPQPDHATRGEGSYDASSIIPQSP